MMCRVLSVSRSGYYDWLKRLPSQREQENIILAHSIKQIFDTEKQRVGAPRITRRLRISGQKVGKNRVAKVMQQLGIRAKGVKKYKATTNSRHGLPVAPNLLEQNFEAISPNQKWVSDISVPQQAA